MQQQTENGVTHNASNARDLQPFVNLNRFPISQTRKTQRHRKPFHSTPLRLEVANNINSRCNAYAMVYTLYRKMGYAAFQDSGMWYSLFDALPKSTTLTVQNENHLLMTATLIVDSCSGMGLPSDEIYETELKTLRASGARLGELVSFCCIDNPPNGSQAREILFESMYLLSHKIRNLTHLVIAVNPKHVSFHCQEQGFEVMGPVRTWSKVLGAPAVLLSLDLRTVASKFTPRSRLNHSSTDDRIQSTLRMLKKKLMPMSEQEIQFFFANEMKNLMTSNPRFVSVLKRAYPTYNLHNLSLQTAKMRS